MRAFRTVGVAVLVWGAGLAEAQEPRLGIEDCPATAIYGQAADSGSWLALSHLGGAEINSMVVDNFPLTGTLAQPIERVRWWAFTVDGSASWTLCDDVEHANWRITFFADEDGSPGAVVASFDFTIPPIWTEQFAPYGYAYTAVLPSTLYLDHGFIGIATVEDGFPCFGAVLSSADVTGDIWRWDGTNFTTYDLENEGLSFCLIPPFGIPGACCDDRTGECVQSFDYSCEAIFGRFVANTQCANISPQCGLGTGACCAPDGTCSLKTFAECEPGDGTGGFWAGPGTNCATHCANLTCPGGAVQDGETCGDTSNDGCSATAPPLCPGDLDCNGVVDFDDIPLFVAVLTGGTAPCPENAECNGIPPVNFDDIPAFVSLIGTECP